MTYLRTHPAFFEGETLRRMTYTHERVEWKTNATEERRCYPAPAMEIQRDTFSIRWSTNADLQKIRSWLEQEESAAFPGNFLCNWTAIENEHKRGKLLVCLEERSNNPIGFQLGGLVHPGILQVKNDFRGQGIGRKLVDRCIELAERRNECFLSIQCKPSSSIKFWERMGFTLIPNDRENSAYRILSRRLLLPKEGKPVNVIVRFYPEDVNERLEIAQNSSLKISAVKTSDSVIHLSERVMFCELLFPRAQYGDAFVDVEVDRQRYYSGKAGYPEAMRIGVQRCSHGFYVDRIRYFKSLHSE